MDMDDAASPACCPQNERVKRAYFEYLREAQRYSEASITVAASAISRFERWNRYRDFKKFRVEQAVAFKHWLAEQPGNRQNTKLSRSTLDSTLRALRAFFVWLASRPGYKRAISFRDGDYFNLSRKDMNAARNVRPKRIPTVDQIHRILARMPCSNLVEQRNRALVATAALTGARVDALRTVRMKHLDLAERCLTQDPNEMETKFSKLINTWFFPIGGDAIRIVEEWTDILQTQLHWAPDDALFPAPELEGCVEGGFRTVGLLRTPWKTTKPIREIFRNAFAAADVPYANPHTMRDMLCGLGLRLAKSPEEFKAWSQNLGHDGVLTTFTSYGELPPDRQAQLIRTMTSGHSVDASQELASELQRMLDRLRSGR